MADKQDAQEELMPLADLKRLVPLGERGAISCAIGLTKEKTALLLVHKQMSPKKLRDKMKKDAKASLDLNSLRFGQITIAASDPGTVQFNINKSEVGGTIAAMVRLVKKTGYQGAVFNLDPNLEAEPEEGAAPAAPPAPPGAPAAPSQSPAPAAGAAAPPPPPPPAPPASAQQQPDWAALGTTLAGLAQQIATVAGSNPMLKDPLVKIATVAQTAVKGRQDFAAAGRAVDALRQGLARAAEQAKLSQQAQAGGGPVTYAKSRLAWLAARKKVESDIETLRGAIVATYQEDGIAPALEKAFKERVAPVLAALDERLADTLDDAINATDPAKRAKLVAEAKDIMGDYATFLSTDKTIAALDTNPFVPLSIQNTIAATLSTLSKAIR